MKYIRQYCHFCPYYVAKFLFGGVMTKKLRGKWPLPIPRSNIDSILKLPVRAGISIG